MLSVKELQALCRDRKIKEISRKAPMLKQLVQVGLIYADIKPYFKASPYRFVIKDALPSVKTAYRWRRRIQDA
jgi:hypothetical protein